MQSSVALSREKHIISFPWGLDVFWISQTLFLALATPNTAALPEKGQNVDFFGGTESLFNSMSLGCSESTPGNITICFWCSDKLDFYIWCSKITGITSVYF